jgi:hypothetical protein
MNYSRNDLVPRDLLPFALSLIVPLAICVVVMLVETGIERAFFYAAIKVAVILIALGLAISYGVGRWAAKHEADDGVHTAGDIPPRV